MSIQLNALRPPCSFNLTKKDDFLRLHTHTIISVNAYFVQTM